MRNASHRSEIPSPSNLPDSSREVVLKICSCVVVPCTEKNDYDFYFTVLFVLYKFMTSQPYGPTDQEHLSTPGVNQEFCVFSKNKFVYSSMQPLKLVTLQESEHCTLYCTLEPNCFFTEYNPTIKLCKMFSFLATCENLRNQGYDLIFSWKSSSIYSTLYDLCEHYAYRSVSRGGKCRPKTNQTLQYYSDKEYYLNYGAITGVVVWKKGYFRAIQLR